MSRHPFKSVSWEKSLNHSLGKKLAHTFFIFSGDLDPTNEFANLGLLDYVPFLAPKDLWQHGFRWLWKRGEGNLLIRLASRFFALLLSVLTFGLWVAQTLLALGLTIVSAPFVAVVHFFVGPGYENEKPPLRHSLPLNPTTWLAIAASSIMIALLIQSFGPIDLVAQAAAPLGILLSASVVLAALTTIYALGRYGYEKFRPEKVIISSDSDKNITEAKPKSLQTHSSIIAYFMEFKQWCKNNPNKKIVFYIGFAVMLILAVTVTGIFFSGGAGLDVTQMFESLGQCLTFVIDGMLRLFNPEFVGLSSGVGTALAGTTLLILPFVITGILFRVSMWLWPEKIEVIEQSDDFVDDNAQSRGFLDEYSNQEEVLTAKKVKYEEKYLEGSYKYKSVYNSDKKSYEDTFQFIETDSLSLEPKVEYEHVS